jgi:hypothetical protein
MPVNKHEVLVRIPLFASLNPPEVDALAQRAIEKQFATGEILFNEGEECAARGCTCLRRAP